MRKRRPAGTKKTPNSKSKDDGFEKGKRTPTKRGKAKDALQFEQFPDGSPFDIAKNQTKSVTLNHVTVTPHIPVNRRKKEENPKKEIWQKGREGRGCRPGKSGGSFVNVFDSNDNQVKPRKLGLSETFQSPLAVNLRNTGAVKSRQNEAVIVDDSDVIVSDDNDIDNSVVIVDKPVLCRPSPKVPKVKRCGKSPMAMTTKLRKTLISPEYQSSSTSSSSGRGRFIQSIRHMKSPLPYSSKESPEGISPGMKTSSSFGTPMRTLLLDDILSSQTDSQVDVRWDCRSPNAIKDARIYNSGCGQDGSDLINMLKQVNEGASPVHTSTPPLLSKLYQSKEESSDSNSEAKKRNMRMSKRPLKKKRPCKDQTLDFLQKLTEYIENEIGHENQDEGNTDEKQNEGNTDIGSPKLISDEDNEGQTVIDKDQGPTVDEIPLSKLDTTVSSTIATQLEPSPVINPVTLSRPLEAKISLPKADANPFEVSLLSGPLEAKVSLPKADANPFEVSLLKLDDEECDSETKKGEGKSIFDEFTADDTLDDLFCDNSFLEQTTQMTKELYDYDEKTKKFKTPKVLNKTSSLNVQKNQDCQSVNFNSAETSKQSSISSAESWEESACENKSGVVPPVRQNLFVKNGAGAANMSKTTISAASVCTTCVSNRISPGQPQGLVSTGKTQTFALKTVASGKLGSYMKAGQVNPFPSKSSNNVTLTSTLNPNSSKYQSSSSTGQGVHLVSSMNNAKIAKPVYSSAVSYPTRSSTAPSLSRPKTVPYTNAVPAYRQTANSSSMYRNTGAPSTITNATSTVAAPGNKSNTVTGSQVSSKSSVLHSNYKSGQSAKLAPVSVGVGKTSNMTNSTSSHDSSKKSDPKAGSSKSSTLSDSAVFDDLPEDLLFQLTEPDEILDSQVFSNSGSSSASTEGAKVNPAKSGGSERSAKSNNSCSKPIVSSVNTKVNCSQAKIAPNNVSSVSVAKNSCSSNSVSNSSSAATRNANRPVTVSLSGKNTGNFARNSPPVSTGSSFGSQSFVNASGKTFRAAGSVVGTASNLALQSSTKSSSYPGNQTNPCEASTFILESSDSAVIPPTQQPKPKPTATSGVAKLKKFTFKSTSLNQQSGGNTVTRSQTKQLHASQESGQGKTSPGSSKGVAATKPIEFDDNDDLFEPEVLAMLEDAEMQASQASVSSQCSTEQIERKKREAMKRREARLAGCHALGSSQAKRVRKS